MYFSEEDRKRILTEFWTLDANEKGTSMLGQPKQRYHKVQKVIRKKNAFEYYRISLNTSPRLLLYKQPKIARRQFKTGV